MPRAQSRTAAGRNRAPESKKPIARAISELKHTLITIAFTQAYLDALVAFLLSVLIFQLVRVAWLYAFVPFLLYFVFRLYGSLRYTRLAYAEEKAPFLAEQLRTAADHVACENGIVEELHADVVRKMREIRNSFFISFGKVTGRLFTLIIVAFLTIFAAAADVHFLDFNQLMSDVKQARMFEHYDINESLLAFNESDEGDIFGDKSLAELGTQELDLQITPLMTDIDINQVKPPEQRDFHLNSRAQEIQAVADASFGDPIPKGYTKIVRNYFRDLNRQ